MEALRQTLKILFHSKRPSQILQQLKSNPRRLADESVDKEAFCRLFANGINWQASLDNADSVFRHLNDVWMKGGEEDRICYAARLSIFNVLLHFSSQILIERNAEPVCRYEHLLRWHDVTTLLGEDLLTTSYLAAKDLYNHQRRTDFCWPTVIGHDNRPLNELLRKPLTDLHFHLNGSSLNFELNWMSLMNKTYGWSAEFKKLRKLQHQELTLVDDTINEPFYLCVMKASALRMLLFEYAYYGHDIETKPTTDRSLADKILQSHTVEEVIPYIREMDTVAQRLRHTVGKRYVAQDGSARIPDYATLDKITVGILPEDERYPFTTLAGERWLMYEIFREIYENSRIGSEIVSWFYAYLLYKAKFRTELVQANDSVGFANFALYENRKSTFIRNRSVYSSLLGQMAVAGFLRKPDRRLEVRITPKSSKSELLSHIKKSEYDITEPHFMPVDIAKDIQPKYGYILHFIKKTETAADEKLGKCRHYALRYSVKRQACAIFGLRSVDSSIHTYGHRILGIDAANSEVYARPEVFAQAFRYLRDSRPHLGVAMPKDLGLTYHVGEDFLDVVDGLRAVDEVVHFIGFRNGDRIGHGLVLGIDVTAYYKDAHNTIIMPTQMLLDNVAWLYNKGRDLPEFISASRDLEILFETYYQKVYGHLSIRASLWEYYLSWLLRGDNPMYYLVDNHKGPHKINSRWGMFNLNDDRDAAIARKGDMPRKLYSSYHFDAQVRKVGKATTQEKLSEAVVAYIVAVQKKMIAEIERANICIECNPTSNLRIGHFDAYSTHPIVRLFNYQLPTGEEQHSLSVSINTDDKGIFATSLEREYSLLALGLEKKYVADGKCSPRQIYDWLDKIRQTGFEQIF